MEANIGPTMPKVCLVTEEVQLNNNHSNRRGIQMNANATSRLNNEATHDDTREFLEGIKEKMEAAERDFVQIARLFNGLQGIASVLEYVAQPGNAGSEIFSGDFDVNISELLGVMGDYGAALAQSQLEHDGLGGASSDLWSRVEGMKEGAQ